LVVVHLEVKFDVKVFCLKKISFFRQKRKKSILPGKISFFQAKEEKSILPGKISFFSGKRGGKKYFVDKYFFWRQKRKKQFNWSVQIYFYKNTTRLYF